MFRDNSCQQANFPAELLRFVVGWSSSRQPKLFHTAGMEGIMYTAGYFSTISKNFRDVALQEDKNQFQELVLIYRIVAYLLLGMTENYYLWLLFCVVGMVSSLTMYGIVLEYTTSGDRKLHELSFVFVTTAIYSITAYIARSIFGERPTETKYQMLTLSLTSIASTYTSVRSLRYVIYPVQVLFKSCKPVPVMIFGVVLGTRYSLSKYVNVIVITAGVALFMMGGASSGKSDESNGGVSTALIGALLLSVSLCFDGMTGAYEEQLMSRENVGTFDLMYNIQFGKAVISFVALVATNGLNEFIRTLSDGGISLVMLGLTGAIGQVFVFLTINKFGALNCALIGLIRKILSLVLSFVLYGHAMNVFQGVGLFLAITAMIFNFIRQGGGGHGHGSHSAEQQQRRLSENQGLLVALPVAEVEATMAHHFHDGRPTVLASAQRLQ